MTASYRRYIILVLIYAFIAILFTLSIFEHINYWGIEDWDFIEFQDSLTRATILHYRQFPFWNPYMVGGLPLLGHPEANTFSLSFLVMLIFGVIKGHKINIALHVFLGMFGVHLLGRHYKLTHLSSMLAAFVFMLSSMFALTLTVGMAWGYSIAYIPWVFCFFNMARQRFFYSFPAAIILAMMWYSGGIYPFCITIAFLGIFSFIGVCCRELPVKKTVVLLTTVYTLTLMLGAFKLLPAIELTVDNTRQSNFYTGYSVESLAYGLFGRDQTISAFAEISPTSGKLVNSGKSRREGFLRGFTFNMDETGMYIGLAPFLLALVGIFASSRNHKALAFCLLIFLWISLGFRSDPLSLWRLVKQVPLFNVMRVAERFRFVFMLCLAIYAAFGFQWLQDWLAGKFKNTRAIKLASMILVIAVLADLFWVNAPVFKNAFPIPPLKISRNEKFVQSNLFPYYDENGYFSGSTHIYSTYGSIYPAFLSNVGILEAPETMPVPRKPVPIGSPDYRGEVFLEGTTGRASYGYWSPNRLRVDVAASGNGYLVINQNYYKGWRLEGQGGEALSVDGLLAARITPETTSVEFYYLPDSLVRGGFISFLTLIFMAVSYFWFNKQKVNGVIEGQEQI